MRSLTPETCDRARRWVSLGLDDGLAELEARMLHAHLARCAECRGFEARVRAVTEGLRSAEPLSLERPIALPSQRRRITGLRVASASAAAAAAVAVVGVLSVVSSGNQVRPAFLVQAANVQNTEAADLRAARRSEMVAARTARPFTHVQISGPERI